MKELLNGIWALSWALIVSVFMFTVGTGYTLGYGIWFSRKAKKQNRWSALFRYLFRVFDGLCAAIGHALYEIAYSLDLGWNVNGEIIEDVITAQDDTAFGEKNVSVSASVGKIEIDNKLNPSGKIFSKILNFFFWQKQHAVDAWNYTKAKKELQSKYFESKK